MGLTYIERFAECMAKYEPGYYLENVVTLTPPLQNDTAAGSTFLANITPRDRKIAMTDII